MLVPGDFPRPSVPWLELPDKSMFVLEGDCQIGRIEGNDIVDPDTRISRRNTIVQRQGNHFMLIDLGSTNGTFLNENRIYRPTQLVEGDVITVGSVRYVFHEPRDSVSPIGGSDDPMVYRTEVVVTKLCCWMVLAAAPVAAGAPAADWLEQVRQRLVPGGAGVRRVPTGGLFAHWREGRTGSDKVRAVLLEIGGLSRPRGARLAAHYGAVRVGPAARPGEENLLGPDVTLVYGLDSIAAGLGEDLILSDSAVRSLGLESSVQSLGVQQVRDVPGMHTLFTLRKTTG